MEVLGDLLGETGPVGVVVELGHDHELGRGYPVRVLVVALPVLARGAEEQVEQRGVMLGADPAVAIEHAEDPCLKLKAI